MILYSHINNTIKLLYSSLSKIAGRSHHEDEEGHFGDPAYPNYGKEKLENLTEDFNIENPDEEAVAEGEFLPDKAFKYEVDRERNRNKNFLAVLRMITNNKKLVKLREVNPEKYEEVVGRYKKKLQVARNFQNVYKNFVREMAGIDAFSNPQMDQGVSDKFKKIKKIRDMENERNPGTYDKTNIDLKPFTHKKDILDTEEILYKKKLVLDKIDSLLGEIDIYREKINPAYSESVDANSLAVKAYEEIENIYKRVNKYKNTFLAELSHLGKLHSDDRTMLTEKLTESAEELEVELDKIGRYVDQISEDIQAYEMTYEDLKQKSETNKYLVGYISKFIDKLTNIAELGQTKYRKNFGTEFFTNAYSSTVEADPREGSDEYFGYDGLDVSNEEAVYKFFTEGAPQKQVDNSKEDIVTFRCAIPSKGIDWEKMDKNYSELGDYESDPLMHVIYVKPGAQVIIIDAFYNDRDVDHDNINLNKTVVTANNLPKYIEYIRMAYFDKKIYHEVEPFQIVTAAYREDLTDYSVDFWQERDRASVVVTNNLTGKTVFESWDEDVHNDIDLGLYEFGNAESVLDYLRESGLIQ